jgi:hypothetical protein
MPSVIHLPYCQIGIRYEVEEGVFINDLRSDYSVHKGNSVQNEMSSHYRRRNLMLIFVKLQFPACDVKHCVGLHDAGHNCRPAEMPTFSG